MPKSSKKISTDQLGRLIYEIRGKRVMLDSDLASIYGVETKALNRAVKPNTDRFPKDFMFQISADEWAKLEVPNWHLKTDCVKPTLKCWTELN
jgi:ORF6N domain